MLQNQGRRFRGHSSFCRSGERWNFHFVTPAAPNEPLLRNNSICPSRCTHQRPTENESESANSRLIPLTPPRGVFDSGASRAITATGLRRCTAARSVGRSLHASRINAMRRRRLRRPTSKMLHRSPPLRSPSLSAPTPPTQPKMLLPLPLQIEARSTSADAT